MTAVILQPAGNKDSVQHYADTIESRVLLSSISGFLDLEDQEILSQIYPFGYSPIWGVTPGKNGQNAKKWERIQPGDLTLFVRNGRVISSGVTYPQSSFSGARTASVDVEERWFHLGVRLLPG